MANNIKLWNQYPNQLIDYSLFIKSWFKNRNNKYWNLHKYIIKVCKSIFKTVLKLEIQGNQYYYIILNCTKLPDISKFSFFLFLFYKKKFII